MADKDAFPKKLLRNFNGVNLTGIIGDPEKLNEFAGTLIPQGKKNALNNWYRRETYSTRCQTGQTRLSYK